MACSTCPGAAPPGKASPPSFARHGMQVRVTSEAEVQRIMALNPGYSATRSSIGPMNIILTLTPRPGR